MEKWQIYLYLFFVVTILHALYDKRTKLAVGACAFFAIVVGAIKYATYGLYSGLLAFVLLLAPAAVGASMQKSGILNKVLDESDDNTEAAPPVPLASALLQRMKISRRLHRKALIRKEWSITWMIMANRLQIHINNASQRKKQTMKRKLAKK